MEKQNKATDNEDGRPPIFSSWKGWYGLLIGNLIFWIVALYLLTIAYS